MGISKSRLTIINLLFILSFLICISHANNYLNKNSSAVMFVFGDSLFDPGNSIFLNVTYKDKADRWPYGETFFKRATGRFSDGRLIPDFIAEYVKIPYWKPYLEPGQQFTYGANFATGGAAILPQLNQETINLDHQLSFFKELTDELKEELGEKEVKEKLMEAVYLTSIGGVDCYIYAEENPNATLSHKQEFVNNLIGNLTIMIQEIYKLGGRKFAFQNAAPMGCSPSAKQSYGLTGDNCVENIEAMTKLYNDALPKAFEYLESELEGFKYLVFDYYSLVYDMIQNPSKYDFEVVNIACCGYGLDNGVDCGIPPFELCSNVSEYLYFDGGHPTDKANEQLSKYLWDGESPLTIPYNFKHLLNQESELLSL